jgi:hypothetical protein
VIRYLQGSRAFATFAVAIRERGAPCKASQKLKTSNIMKTNTINDLKFENINFDGSTVNSFNGKEFTACNKVSGFGSGKKTVGTFTVNGTRYENIAIDRLRSLLGDGSTRTTKRTPATISGYCSKIVGFFEEGTTRYNEVKKACDALTKLEAKYIAEDEAKAAEYEAIIYLQSLSDDALKSLLMKAGKM